MMSADRDRTSNAGKPGILLHVCCAPCATYVVEALRPSFGVTGYFYNPNVHPESEYILRKEEAERFTSRAAFPFHTGEYDVERWFDLVKGHEDDPEGGERCAICYRMRLEEAARFAGVHGFECFATTLSVSPHKSAAIINRIGRELGARYGIEFYEADFKKRDGFKISCRISRELGLYRQSYCGCVFSVNRAEE